jgi:hypothetical protein
VAWITLQKSEKDVLQRSPFIDDERKWLPMLVSKFKRWVLTTVACAALWLAFQEARTVADEPTKKATPPSKLDLTTDSFSKLFALIRPQPTEWRHLQVQWFTDVVAARRLAAKEDKPLVVLYTGGAGYNEPLGVC